MKKYLLFLVIISFIGLCFIPRKLLRPVSAQGRRARFVDGQLLVKYRPEIEETDIERDIGEQVFKPGSAAVESLHTHALGKLYLVKLPQGVSVEETASMMRRNPRVEYAEPNYYLYPTETTPDDPLFAMEWGMSNSGNQPPGGKAGADINAPKAWDITTGSDDTVVAVVDTGVDLAHQDLSPNAWVNPREINGNGVDDDGNGLVDDVHGWNFFDGNNQLFDPVNDVGFSGGHGTHVSGTIGAVGNNGLGVAGVAWHVKIMVLKFIGRQSS